MIEHKYRSWWLDGTVIFLLTAALIWPLFRLKYLDNWASIESTFIADARMLSERSGLWQPDWYAGTRSSYVYPPALRYGTAYLAKAIHSTTARGYHLYTAIYYCFGIVAVYLFARTGTRSQRSAWLAAAGIALLSPVFVFLPELRADSAHWVPQRLHVLMQYGEGPHVSALCVLPLVFAAMLRACEHRSSAWMAMAAVACALVVSNNFYGLTALAILLPLLVWSCLCTRRDLHILWKAALVGALAYGLTAAWLTPSYLRITRENLKLVAEPANTTSIICLAAIVVLYAAVTWRIARQANTYTMFVVSGLFFLSVYIFGRRYFNFQVAGVPYRLVPELDLFLILGGVELLRRLHRNAARVLIVVAFGCALPYLTHAYSPFPKDSNWQDRVEYRISEWIYQHYPQERALATGSIRFWYDAWHTLPQIDGGSQQGTLNQNIPAAVYQIMHNDHPEVVKAWLLALGVDIAIIPGKDSKEIYHDISFPDMWRRMFPVLWEDGAGNVLYRIPRSVPGIARVVKTAGLAAVTAIPTGTGYSQMSYVDAIENGAKPARCVRQDSDNLRIEADVAAGESVLVQETFDPAWKAYVGAERVLITKDPIGFMLLQVPAGHDAIRMEFETPVEVRIGRWVTLFSFLVAGFLLARGRLR